MYDINYFYNIIKEYDNAEDYKTYEKDGKLLNITLLYNRDFEFKTRNAKVPHFAPVEIDHLSFSEHLITFAYQGERVPSAINYEEIDEVAVIQDENNIYNFVIALKDGMIIKL